MTIREVLEADWNVNKIDITVRERNTTKYIMRYCIGRDVEPGRCERFLYEAEVGDMHGTTELKTLYINRTIQFYQLEDKPQGKGMCRGVLLKEIPKEILELTIDHMGPRDCGRSDDMHGYMFVCYVDAWGGIAGETKQVELFNQTDI